MKKLLALTLASCIAAPSFAWGDREQGALLGLIIGGAAVNIMNQNQQGRVIVQPQQPQQVIILPPAQQAPIIDTIPPRTGTCLQHPIYDQYGRVIAYQLSCH